MKEHMSHITCPLCGLNVPLSTFWDNIYNAPEDIEAVSFVGLGRGRRFMKTEAFSVLDEEEFCDAIAWRCHAILSLVDDGYLVLIQKINDLLPDDVPWIDDLVPATDALITEYFENQEE